MYVKQEVLDFGGEVADLILGILNGFQTEEELTNAMAAFTAAAKAANELQTDTDAALLDTLSGLAGRVADSRRDDLVAPTP